MVQLLLVGYPTASQFANNNIDDNQCNNFDINFGSVAGSAIGGGWAAGITRGAGNFSGAIGTELGK